MFSLPVLVCCIHTYVDLGFLRHVQWGGRYCRSLIYQSEVSAQDLSKHNQFKLEGKSNYLHPQARLLKSFSSFGAVGKMVPYTSKPKKEI